MLIKDVVDIKGGFVRAVKIPDDFFNEELNKWKLESYLVNPSARETFYSISKGLHPTSKDRAHIISGTYGSGKSHFGLVLANYLTKDSASSDLRMVFTRIKEKDPNIASEIKNIRNIDRPYLVVLIEGFDSDGINHALLKNLREAIILPERGKQRGEKEALKEEVLQTSYQSALNKIKEWEDEKSAFIKEFQDLLEERETDIETLKHGLEEPKEEAYTLFKELHQKITLAHFEPLYGYEDVYEVYEKINKALVNKYGHRGIVIIWDQFNEHIEQRSTSSLLGDISILRHFAEEIERSGEYQIHLILISHNLPHTYIIERITKESLDNWITTERRFKEHTLTAIGEAEELIGYAITKLKDKEEWEQIEKNIEKSTKLVDVIIELGLYPQKNRKWVIDTICNGTYPLHPITTYCLPMISDVVGQEAGTMFTFFEGTLEGGLTRFTNETQIFTSDGKLNLYTVDLLFHFFRKAIEESPKTTNLMRNFNDAINNKVNDPKDILTQRVLKSLVVIKTIQSRYSIPPLTIASTLSIILEVEEPKLNLLLESLVKSDVLWKRENGEYEFRTGEVLFDFSRDFREAKERVILDSPILELRKYYPPEPVIAKGYEEEYKVARRLDVDYLNVDGLENLRNYENEIKSQYKDGILLYVIAETQEDITEAKREALNRKHPQILIAIPKSPLNIYEPLKNIKALEDVEKRHGYQQEEAHNIWLDKYNSEKSKLDNEIRNLKEVSNLSWFLEGDPLPLDVTEMKESEIADHIMFNVFNKTPVVLHRKMADKFEKDQRAHRIELNTLILAKKGKIEYPAKGKPAEKTILEQTFKPQGMLKEKREGNFDYYEIIEPINENMKEVWNLMKKFLMESGRYSKFDKLVETLQMPPYGLSLRVVELFLSAFLGMFKDYFIIKTRRKKLAPWEQEAFTGDAINKIVNDPSKALIEYIELPDLFSDYILVIDDILPIEKKWEDKFSEIENVGRLFVEWFNKIPQVTKSSADLDPKYKKFIVELKNVNLDCDMRELLIERLPNALGMQNIIAWEKRALKDFEKEFKEIITELNDYPSKVEKEVMDVFKEVFEIKGETASAVIGKLGNWYYELDPSVKQTPPSQDAAKLMKCIRIQSDFRQGFLVILPEEIGISEYTKWTDIPYKLKEYSDWLKKTKSEIETRQKKIATSLKQKIKLVSPKAHSLKRLLKERIEFARKDLEKKEIITILEELLEEYRG